METTRGAYQFILLIALLIAGSMGAIYYRYIYLGNFDYFVTEDEIPDSFDVNAYR